MQKTVRENFHKMRTDAWTTVDATASLDDVTARVQELALEVIARDPQLPLGFMGAGSGGTDGTTKDAKEQSDKSKVPKTLFPRLSLRLLSGSYQVADDILAGEAERFHLENTHAQAADFIRDIDRDGDRYSEQFDAMNLTLIFGMYAFYQRQFHSEKHTRDDRDHISQYMKEIAAVCATTLLLAMCGGAIHTEFIRRALLRSAHFAFNALKITCRNCCVTLDPKLTSASVALGEWSDIFMRWRALRPVDQATKIPFDSHKLLALLDPPAAGGGSSSSSSAAAHASAWRTLRLPCPGGECAILPEELRMLSAQALPAGNRTAAWLAACGRASTDDQGGLASRGDSSSSALGAGGGGGGGCSALPTPVEYASLGLLVAMWLVMALYCVRRSLRWAKDRWGGGQSREGPPPTFHARAASSTSTAAAANRGGGTLGAEFVPTCGVIVTD